MNVVRLKAVDGDKFVCMDKLLRETCLNKDKLEVQHLSAQKRNPIWPNLAEFGLEKKIMPLK